VVLNPALETTTTRLSVRRTRVNATCLRYVTEKRPAHESCRAVDAGGNASLGPSRRGANDAYLFVSLSSMRRLRRSVSSLLPSSRGWNSP
jgi:hypothetical protein